MPGGYDSGGVLIGLLGSPSTQSSYCLLGPSGRSEMSAPSKARQELCGRSSTRWWKRQLIGSQQVTGL